MQSAASPLNEVSAAGGRQRQGSNLGGLFQMKHLFAAVLAVLVAAVIAPAALADNDGKTTLGPAGDNGTASRTL